MPSKGPQMYQNKINKRCNASTALAVAEKAELAKSAIDVLSANSVDISVKYWSLQKLD